MLAKIVLVLIYLLLVFLAAKVLDITSNWFEISCVASHLFNPFALSVKKLKTLLDERGVSYAGIVDKKDLAQLVHESGTFNTEESCTRLENDLQSAETSTEITHFESASHLYEEVEDTKASGWLVLVIPWTKPPLLRQNQWKQLSNKVTRFGIRTGVFDCALEPVVCARNGWENQCLILSSPRSDKPKGHVVINMYNSKPSVEHVFTWMNNVLARRVKRLHSHADYLDFLRKDRENTNPTKVVMFSRLDEPPALLSSLSIKFTGRVTFGYFKITRHNTQSIHEKIKINKIPSILIVTPEQQFYYGTRKGENLRFKPIELFLANIHPEVNDIFLWTTLLINQACFLELFLSPGGILRKSVKFFVVIGAMNTVLVVSWLPLMNIFKLATTQPLVDVGLKLCRFLMTSDIVSLARYYILTHPTSMLWFLTGFCLYGFLLNRIKKRLRSLFWSDVDDDDDDEDSADWFQQDIAYYRRFFYSFRSTSNIPPNLRVFEDGLELFIEHLTIPDLWLHPILPTDFVKDLPLWKNCNCEQQKERESELKITTSCCMGETAIPNCDPNTCQITNKPENVIFGKECVICLENYTKDCVMVGLPCLHAFHQKCMEKWFISSNHCRSLNCPVCRWPAYKSKHYLIDRQ